MSNFISKFFYILGKRNLVLVGMITLFIFTSLLELIGIGLVGTFVSIVTHPSRITEYDLLSNLYSILNLNSEHQLILLISVFLIFIFYIKAYLAFKAQQWIFQFGFNQQQILASRLMKVYLSAPYAFHLQRNSAFIVQNIVDETQKCCNGFIMPLLTFISNLLITVAIVIFLVTRNVLACLVIGGLLIIAVLLFQSLKHQLTAWGKQASVSRSEMIRTINEGMAGLKENRVIGCEPYFQNRLADSAQKYATSTALALSYSNLPRYVIEAFLITFLVLFTLITILIIGNDSGDFTSTLSIFALASIRLMPIASNLTNSLNSIKNSSYAVDKIYADLKELEPIRLSKQKFGQHNFELTPTYGNGLHQLKFNEEIQLDSLFYHYPQSDLNALENVSLSISKGQSIGLIGKSGAGKTTLVDVILGLLIPQSGDIRVDGVSIYDDLRTWQNIVGYVPQSIALIDESIGQNIALGVPEEKINYRKLEQAIEAAQLSELVSQLPNGIDTQIGERGVMLSGGQRQRLGIARALYHEREVIVFDEATAALDNETERMVTESIRALTGKKTMIIIAHRLSTIEHCDLIVQMSKGCVSAIGSYQEIIPKTSV